VTEHTEALLQAAQVENTALRRTVADASGMNSQLANTNSQLANTNTNLAHTITEIGRLATAAVAQGPVPESMQISAGITGAGSASGTSKENAQLTYCTNILRGMESLPKLFNQHQGIKFIQELQARTTNRPNLDEGELVRMVLANFVPDTLMQAARHQGVDTVAELTSMVRTWGGIDLDAVRGHDASCALAR
jgi:hypothetical protein